jgi:hypothetical protein
VKRIVVIVLSLMSVIGCGGHQRRTIEAVTTCASRGLRSSHGKAGQSFEWHLAPR